jgi:hypothetical protein
VNDNLRILKKTQEEAKRIINSALIKADKIKQGLLQKSMEAYEEAYLTEIAQAEKFAKNSLKSSSKGIDLEIEQLLMTAKQLAINVENQAITNEEEAVKHIINLVFYRSEKI